MRVILLFLTSSDIAKILPFQHLINIKIINKIFYFPFSKISLPNMVCNLHSWFMSKYYWLACITNTCKVLTTWFRHSIFIRNTWPVFRFDKIFSWQSKLTYSSCSKSFSVTKISVSKLKLNLKLSHISNAQQPHVAASSYCLYRTEHLPGTFPRSLTSPTPTKKTPRFYRLLSLTMGKLLLWRDRVARNSHRIDRALGQIVSHREFMIKAWLSTSL